MGLPPKTDPSRIGWMCVVLVVISASVPSAVAIGESCSDSCPQLGVNCGSGICGGPGAFCDVSNDCVGACGNSIDRRCGGYLASCQYDQDCAPSPFRLTCHYGLCTDAGISCSSSQDCPYSLCGEDNQCGGNGAGCNSNHDCTQVGSSRCNNNLCGGINSDCSNNGDCRDGLACKYHKCVPPQSECIADFMCESNECSTTTQTCGGVGADCSNGVCGGTVACSAESDTCGDAGSLCTSSNDCDQSQYACIGGLCRGKNIGSNCTLDVECHASFCGSEGCGTIGAECEEDYECVVGVSCAQDGFCGGRGALCSSSQQCSQHPCSGGHCGGPGAECVDDSSCMNGVYCHNQVCGSVGAQCSTPGTCISGVHCVDTFCGGAGASCQSQSDCIDSYDCGDSTCGGPGADCHSHQCNGGASFCSDHDEICGGLGASCGVCRAGIFCSPITQTCGGLDAHCSNNDDCWLFDANAFCNDDGLCKILHQCSNDTICQTEFSSFCGIPSGEDSGFCGAKGASCQQGSFPYCVDSVCSSNHCGGLGSPCRSDSDCFDYGTDVISCEAGLCRATGHSCENDTQCFQATHCSDSDFTCGGRGAACSENYECVAETTCSQGHCFGVGSRCSVSNDCFGSTCFEGFCGAPGAECGSDQECMFGNCHNNICGAIGAGCSESKSCLAPHQCSPDDHTCGGIGAGCISDNDCLDSFLCSNLVCQGVGSSCSENSCAINAGCSDEMCGGIGATCTQNYQCIGADCESNSCGNGGAWCLRDSECIPEFACASSSYTCGGMGAACQNDTECLNSLTCGEDHICGGLGAVCLFNSGCNGYDCESVCGGLNALCTDSSQCFVGSCSSDHCGGKGGSCEDNGDCADSECFGNICGGVGASCGSDQDCHFLECSSGHCGGFNSTCSTDLECFESSCSPDNRCGTVGASCEDNSNCFESECSNGVCGGVGALCTVDDECDQVQCSVATGRCGGLNTECGSHADCFNSVCSPSGQCGGVGAGCVNNTDCYRSTCFRGVCGAVGAKCGGFLECIMFCRDGCFDSECSDDVCGGLGASCAGHNACSPPYTCSPLDSTCGGPGANCNSSCGCVANNCANYGAGGFLCGGTGGTCGDDSQCAPGLTCEGGHCGGLGSTCKETTDCYGGSSESYPFEVECYGLTCGSNGARCVIDDQCLNSNCHNGVCGSLGAGCLSSSDCFGPIDCSDNLCGGSLADCNSDSDCAGRHCSSGLCGGVGAQCFNNFDCGNSIGCGLQDGICGGVGAACSTDADCDGSITCFALSCGSIGAACTTSNDCAGINIVCTGGVCSEKICTQNQECGVETCISGECVPQSNYDESCDIGDDADCATNSCLPSGECAPCIDDSQCDAGNNCVDEECIPPSLPGGSCEDDGDCATGLNLACEALICTFRNCTTPSDCDGGYTCLPLGPFNKCQPPLSAGSPCNADFECASNDCGSNICRCNSNNDCFPFEVCFEEDCRPPLLFNDLCVQTDQCLDGLVCAPIDGQNRCRQCASASDCGVPGSSCMNGFCRSAKQGFLDYCQIDADCMTPYKCSSSNNGKCVECMEEDDGGQGNPDCLSQAPNIYCIYGECQPKAPLDGLCQSAEDCASDVATCTMDNCFVCKEAECPLGSCISTSAECINGYCAPKPCTSNSQCSETCISGLCTETSLPGGPCDDGSDCASYPVCSDGHCGVCFQNTDCVQPGVTCVNGACVHIGETDTCDDPFDCILGDTCIDGKCVDHPCQEDSECSRFYMVCIQGGCAERSPEFGPCDFDDGNSDCQDDLTCIGDECLVEFPENYCLSIDDCGQPDSTTCLLLVGCKKALCTYAPINDGESCDDEIDPSEIDACTTPRICDNGSCRENDEDAPCFSASPCTIAECILDVTAEDGFVCDFSFACPLSSDPCIIATCDEETGECGEDETYEEDCRQINGGGFVRPIEPNNPTIQQFLGSLNDAANGLAVARSTNDPDEALLLTGGVVDYIVAGLGNGTFDPDDADTALVLDDAAATVDRIFADFELNDTQFSANAGILANLGPVADAMTSAGVIQLAATSSLSADQLSLHVELVRTSDTASNILDTLHFAYSSSLDDNPTLQLIANEAVSAVGNMENSVITAQAALEANGSASSLVIESLFETIISANSDSGIDSFLNGATTRRRAQLSECDRTFWLKEGTKLTDGYEGATGFINIRYEQDPFSIVAQMEANAQPTGVTFFNADSGSKLQIEDGAIYVPIPLTSLQVQNLRTADDDDEPECSFFDPQRQKWRSSGRFIRYGDDTPLDEFPGPQCYICEFDHTTDFSVLLSAGSNAGGGGAGGSGNNPFDDTTFLVIWVIGVSLIIMVVVVAIVLVLVGWFFPPARDIIRPKRSNKHIKRARKEAHDREMESLQKESENVSATI